MSEALNNKIFTTISELLDREKVEGYVIGGFVRDFYLKRPSKDIDIVVVGSGLDIAEKLGEILHCHVSLFRNFGTAMLKHGDLEIEFVGARKESYDRNSRKPIVENGTLEDDQNRRDFAINAMAFSLNKENFGELVDPFDGMSDLENKIIRTPNDPDITFSDDPLRMIRAVRFATQLGFKIEEETFEGIKRNAERIKIVSVERISTEIEKIMLSSVPSVGFYLLDKCGLLKIMFPFLDRLKGVEKRGARAHKDNFIHTMTVLDNVAKKDGGKLWLRWAALLHDVAKPATKAWDETVGWTFHGHEVVGSKMTKRIFRDLRLPLNSTLDYVRKLIFLHLRPIALAKEEVTDSAVRRLLFEASNDIDDLMLLCEADITSANDNKVKRYMENFALVRRMLKEIEEKDRVRNFQPPITGEIIMKRYNIPPSSIIGEIKMEIKDAILDGKIRNDYDEAYALMEEIALRRGVNNS